MRALNRGSGVVRGFQHHRSRHRYRQRIMRARRVYRESLPGSRDLSVRSAWRRRASSRGRRRVHGNGRDDRDDVSNTCPRAAERPAQGPIRPTRVHQPFGSADRVLLVSLRQCERSLRRRSNVLCMPTRLRLRTVRTALRPPRRQRGCVLHQERHGLGSLRAVQTVRRADAKLPTVQRAGGRRVD